MSLCDDDTDENNVSMKTCRVCLKSGDMPIFGSIDISEQLIEFADIQIDFYDDFPKYLCTDCNMMLGNAILFRNTAKASDRILRAGEVFTNNELNLNLGYGDELENDESDIKCSEMDVEEKCDVEEPFSIFFEEDKSVSKADPDSDIDKKNSDIENFKYDKTFYVIDPDLIMDEELVDTEPYIPCQYLELEDTISDEFEEINATETVKNFECNECDEIFKSSEELEEHQFLQHDPRTTVKCDICRDIVEKTSYRSHFQLHRDKYKKKWEKKYYKINCEICGTSVSKSYYKYHLKKHGPKDEKAKRRRVCPFCNKSYNIGYLAYHIKHVHEKIKNEHVPSTKTQEALKEQKYKLCPICDRNVKENRLKDHLAMHGKSPRQYICDQCGKVTIHPSAFKLHCMTHGAELKHKCQFCPYRALHMGLLKVHVRTHTKDYLYQCTECPARFITKSNLTMHQRKHGRPDDFKCDICNKTFYSKRNLKQHYTSIHLGIKDAVCDMCGKAFGNRNGMLNHQKKVHKVKNITNRVGRMPSYLKRELKNTMEQK